MKPSKAQYARIRTFWGSSTSPLTVAARLRPKPTTVIAEYIRLDEWAHGPLVGKHAHIHNSI